MKRIEPLERLTLLLAVFSFPLFETPKTIFIVLCALLFIIRHLKEKDLASALVADDPRRGFLALTLATLASAAFALKPGLALHGSYDFVKMYLLFVIIATDFHDRADERAILLAMIVSTAAGSIWGHVDYLRGSTKYFEVHSVGQTNHTTIYLGLSLIGVFHYFFNHLKDKSLPEKACVTACAAIIFSGLMLSSTRGTLLDSGRVLFVFFILFFMRDRRYLKVAAFAGVLAGLALVSTAFFHKAYDPASFFHRLETWQLSWRVFLENPVFGVGPKHFQFVYPPDYGMEAKWYIYPASHPHNLYFTVLSQMGAVGTVALAYLFYLTFRLVARTDKSHRPLVLSVTLAVLAIGFVNTTIHSEHGLLFALLIALGSTDRPAMK